MIVGIDEVGRGAWAGPLAVGAVILGGNRIDGLTDSKLLSKKQRHLLDIEIRQNALGIGIGWVSAKQIDQIGLSEALKLASRRALDQIRHEYHEIIIDGTIALIDDPRVTLMKKADLLIPSVSAASIVAKVARDNYMTHLDGVFPGYNFKTHVGYGTAAHRQAINRIGVTPLHRLSFTPLKKYSDGSRVILQTDPTIVPTNETVVTTKKIGDLAEDEACNYLLRHGHEIIERNWRTKFCEIDIVSSLKDVVYFTEVKYRKKPDQGGGIAAITSKKLRQMKFASEYFVLKNNLTDTNMRLAAITVTGSPPMIEQFLEV